MQKATRFMARIIFDRRRRKPSSMIGLQLSPESQHGFQLMERKTHTYLSCQNGVSPKLFVSLWTIPVPCYGNWTSECRPRGKGWDSALNPYVDPLVSDINTDISLVDHRVSKPSRGRLQYMASNKTISEHRNHQVESEYIPSIDPSTRARCTS